MTASIGVEIETSGRGGFASAGFQGGGIRLGQLPGTLSSEAGARGATSVSPSNAVQNGAATGMLGSGSVAGGVESFQTRWQAMLADLGAGNAQGDGEEAQDASAATATKTGTEADSAAGGRRNSLVGVDKRTRGTQLEVSSRERNALSTLESSATAQTEAQTGAQKEESSDAKPRLAETARTSSGQGNVEAGRKRAKETSAPAMATGSAVLAGQADPVAAAIATSAIAGSAAGPAAAIEDKQPADSSWNALTQGFSESSSSAAVARQPGSGHRISQATGNSGAGKSGMPVASASAKPETAASTAPKEAIGGDGPDTAGPGEAETSADGRVLSAQHGTGAASDASAGPGPSDNQDDRQPGISATNGVDRSRQPAPSPAGADSGQAPALAAAASHPSRAQVVSVRGRKTSETAASAVHAVAAPSSSAADASQLSRSAAGVSAVRQALSHAPAGGSGASRAPGAHETFAALDAEPAAGAPSWIHAGAQQAEAGFEDPALGWVGVRADLGVGGIHAAILPGSADAAQLLSGHLAGLSAHLAAQQIPVDSLRMAAVTGSGNSGADYGGMPSGQQGTGHQGQGQSPEQGATALNSVGAQSERQSVFASRARGFGADQAGRISAEQMLPGSARYISVVA